MTGRIARAGVSPTKPAVVVLVEPDTDNREMYAEVLQHGGFRANAVANAGDALAIARDADVIVTEARLPGGIDGIGLIDRLRHDKWTKDVPTVVLTTSSSHAERQRALAAGCDVLLPKPCLPDALIKAIRRVLRSHHPKPPPTRPARTGRLRRP